MSPNALKLLRDWFIKNAAELPWRPFDVRELRDPYAVWISETMLQQTQVSTVRDYFTRWMKRFPNVTQLAAVDESEVFKYWQGLGYYSRARNILKTAKILVAAGGEFPHTRKELEALPGIGAYTAGAILSLAYHQKEAILDGNLVRIFSRFYALDFLPTDKNVREVHASIIKPSEIYWNYAREIANSSNAYLHNEALMELGRIVCKIKNPECDHCPLRKECKAFASDTAAQYPPKKDRIQKDWHGTVLVIESRDGKILAVQGGQKFFSNQLALPHFESTKGETAGLPAYAENFINADDVIGILPRGKFRHNITVHKMECEVLHIKLSSKAPANAQAALTNGNRFSQKDHRQDESKIKTTWIKKAKAPETLANTFSLKAFALLADS